MDGTAAWRKLFETWPAEVPRKGQVVTNYNETVKFIDYLIGDGIVFLERDRPDAMGARKVMIVYEAIMAVKLDSAVELKEFKIMGFK